MKDHRIIKLRNKAERDLAISDGALRLLLRICSFVFVDPRRKADEPFPLPWSQAAIWCGLDDQKSAYRRIAELTDEKYLTRGELRGSPPIQYFFLAFNSPEKGGIKSPARGGNVTPSRGGINSPMRGGHLISNSFQEERFKERGEELGGSAATKRKGGNGSLRSKETKGDGLAASPKKLTAAEITEECARLRREIESR